MQYLNIHNFGPITNVTNLAINDVMVFIGPQATGKSTIAKLVYFFQMLEWDFIHAITDIAENKQPFSELNFAFSSRVRDSFQNLFSNHLWYNGDYKISYQYSENNTISIYEHGRIEYPFKEEQKYLDLFWNIRKGTVLYDETGSKIRRELLDKYFPSKIPERWGNYLFFVPAGRTRFINTNNKYNQDKVFDKFDVAFQKQKESLYTQDNLEVSPLFVTVAEKILKGKWQKNDRNSIYTQTEKQIPLQFASSGQQEAIILLDAIEKLLKSDKPHYLTVEEPEAHLYPTAQKWITEVLALFVNAKENNKLLITTHSPYILSELDNLVSAAEIAKMGETQKEAVQKIVPDAFWLDFDRIGAYYVENGAIRDIKNDERRSIGANEIDDVSEEISHTFDQLLDIKYG